MRAIDPARAFERIVSGLPTVKFPDRTKWLPTKCSRSLPSTWCIRQSGPRSTAIHCDRSGTKGLATRRRQLSSEVVGSDTEQADGNEVTRRNQWIVKRELHLLRRVRCREPLRKPVNREARGRLPPHGRDHFRYRSWLTSRNWWPSR
jgi:hypothetical protein